jgi:hypothetical protein
MKKFIFILLLLFSVAKIFSQNYEVWLIDGTVLHVDGFGVVDSGRVLVICKDRYKMIDTTDIFAIIQGLDTIYLYSNPSYPLSKAKEFMRGQIEGKNYSAPLLYAGAFISGAITPFALTCLSMETYTAPLEPLLYTILFSKVDNKKIPDIVAQKNADYIRGYKVSATKKNIKNIAIFSYAGLVTGFSVMSLITAD